MREGRKAGWTERKLGLGLFVLGEEDGAEDSAAFGAQDLDRMYVWDRARIRSF